MPVEAVGVLATRLAVTEFPHTEPPLASLVSRLPELDYKIPELRQHGGAPRIWSDDIFQKRDQC